VISDLLSGNIGLEVYTTRGNSSDSEMDETLGNTSSGQEFCSHNKH